MRRTEYKKINQIPEEKPNIRKMLKYTAKKILWVTCYSLSFSKKDTGKEILIKLLGCMVLLKGLFLMLSFALNAVRLVLENTLSSIGFLILTGAFIFKREMKSMFQRNKSQIKKGKGRGKRQSLKLRGKARRPGFFTGGYFLTNRRKK